MPEIPQHTAVECKSCKKLSKISSQYIVIKNLQAWQKADDAADKYKKDRATQVVLTEEVFCTVSCFGVWLDKNLGFRK